MAGLLQATVMGGLARIKMQWYMPADHIVGRWCCQGNIEVLSDDIRVTRWCPCSPRLRFGLPLLAVLRLSRWWLLEVTRLGTIALLHTSAL